MTDLNKMLNITVSRLNDLRNDSELRNLREELKARSDQTTFPGPRGTTFTCPDAQLSSALNGVVRAIDELPALESIEIVITEGSHAVAEAINRLKNTAIGVILEFKLPPSASEIRALAREGKAVNEQTAGLGRDDVIPLAIAIFVDLCIFAVAVRRRRGDQGMIDEIGAILDQAYVQAFGKPPSDAERLGPIQAVGFDHLGGHYAAVPLDFREHRGRGRDEPRRIPAWARGDEGTQLIDGAHAAQQKITEGPPALESQYLNNAFTAFHAAGLVKLLSGPAMLLRGLSKSMARRKLERQHSMYATAGAFRLYKFYGRAWDDLMIILLGGAAGSPRTSSALGRRTRHEAAQRKTQDPTDSNVGRSSLGPSPEPPETKQESEPKPRRRRDEFPGGVDYERS
jgi:hypothetical protein